jgi:hypothetical protein
MRRFCSIRIREVCGLIGQAPRRLSESKSERQPLPPANPTHAYQTLRSIVNTPLEAQQTFLGTGIDFFFLQNILVSRRRR